MQLQETEVRVVRAFYYNKRPTVVGAKVKLPKVFAAEMVAARKAEFVDPEPEQAPATEKAVGKGGKLV